MPPIPLPKRVLAHRIYLRVLLFAGIAVFTAWATFNSYSARLNESTELTSLGQDGSGVSPKAPAGASDARINKNYGKLPLSFEANRGQTNASVKFLARGPGYNIFLTPAEAVLTFQNNGKDSNEATVSHADPESVSDVGPLSPQGRLERLRESGLEQPSSSKTPAVMKMQFEGANRNARVVEGVDELPGKVNYFLGNDSSKWLVNIPTYSKVTYRDVYPGVDLVYYGNQRQLEYDLVVAPGADPDVVKVKFEGANYLRIDGDGNLLLKTAAGDMQQQKPIVYQEKNGERKLIEGRYVMRGKNKVGFRVSRYDRSKPLVIDPVLTYFSIVNNSGDGYAIAVDTQGFAYITGTSQDANFNPTPGGQQQLSGGLYDAFVTKVNQAGNAVVYSTYLGGPDFDESYGIAVDAQGNAYVTGYAGDGFPSTAGVYSNAPVGAYDCFITKLNATGSALLYSTFFGGASFDQGDGIAIDSAGNAFVTGITESTNLPTSAGAVQATAAGGYDGFVMSINSVGSSLRYSTYLGGGGQDYGLALALDSSTNVYVAGQTRSLNFPTVNSFKAAGGLDRGLFKSVDTGTSWSLSRNGLTDSQIAALAVAPGAPTTLYAATTGAVLKSTDSGANWTPTTVNNINFQALAIDPSNSSIVYAGASGGLYKTTDGGTSWTLVYPSFPIQSIIIDPTAPQTIYAGTNPGIIKSTNGGSTWTTVFGSSSILALAIDPTNPAIVYAGRSTGVLKTVNGGTNWSTVNTGLTTTNVRSLAIAQNAPATLFAGTVGGGMFKTTTGGTNWTAVNSGFLTPYTDNQSRLPAQVNAVKVDPTNSSVVYAATTNTVISSGAYPLISILKSTDGGTNWNAITNGFGSVNSGFLSLAIDPTNTSRIYAGNSGDTDGFVTKISPTGAALLFSSYLGSARADNATGIALDSAGNSYVTGFVGGTDFPTTAGVVQSTLRGAVDLFLTKINGAGNIVYSTYFGGSAVEGGIPGVAVDSSGNAYVSGRTASTDFPVTAGAFQTTIGSRGTVGGTDDSVSKFNASGSALIYSSYLGGASNEPFFATTVAANKIAVDAAGNAYVVGVTTDSFVLPVLNYVNGGNGRTYVARIDGNTSSFSITGRLMFSTTPLIGVYVEVKKIGQGFVRYGITDAQGFYSVINLPPGDYTVTPTRNDSQGRHYLFTPASRTFTGLNTDQTADFSGTRIFDINGRVTSSTLPGVGLFDVTVTLSGSASSTATTDANGSYFFQSLLPGNYTVTPSKPGFTFNPVSRTFAPLSVDQFNADFTTASATFFTVSGRITDANNLGVSGADVSMTVKPTIGERSLAVQTDANGNYSFANLQAGGNYTFVPAKPVLTFTPQSQTFSNLSGNQTLNFSAAQATGLIGKIAFAKLDQGGDKIAVMNADGSAETDIANADSQCSGDSGPAWSPDGSKIAFSDGCDFGHRFADLYLMNADGSGVSLLTGADHGEFFPSWSPDATRLTYTFGECSGTDLLVPEIFAIDAGGGNRTQLTDNAFINASSDWSPNGSRIVFARGLKDDCSSTEVGGDPDLYEIDAGGGNERRLTSTSDHDFWPAYSPDASRIAFTRGEQFRQSIYVMNADGTGATRITPESVFAEKPTWAPDGTRIAFSGRLEGVFGSDQIFVINADGTGLVQITSGTADRQLPSWLHYSISGRVTGDTLGQRVTMVLAGTLTRVTQTDANGNYVFGNLTPGGNYSITSKSTAFGISPAQTDVANLVGNQIANFSVVPQVIPTPTPPLADDFAGAQRDPAKWNLGTQTQLMGAFDPAVTVVQTNGQLVIAPRSNVTGPHYNGYVSIKSFDMTGGKASLEMVQPAPGGAETIFAIGSDLDNYFRFVVTTPGGSSSAMSMVKGPDGITRPLDETSAQLLLQVKIAGQLTTLPFPYDPVAHHFMRFRHETPTNSILFETSPNNIDFTIQLRQALQKGLSALAVELSAGTSGPSNPGQAVLDNFSLVTSTFQFSSTGYTVGEGEGSTLITVTRASSTATDAGSVDFETADGTAAQGTKYIKTVGKLTFAPGQLSNTFSVPIVDNVLPEGNQTLNVLLTNSTGSGLNAPGRAVLSIVDNDAGPQLSAASYNVGEGSGTAQVAVTRSDTTAAVTVNYATSDTAALSECNVVAGKASSRCDYATTRGTLQFAVGESSKTIFIPLVDDVYAEGNETLTVTLSSPVGATLGTQTTATVTLQDNESVNGVNPIDSVDFFVRQNYIDFLGREPDPGGLAGWRNVLNNCGTTVAPPCDRIEVSAGFFRSEEFQSRGYFIYRFYSAVGRIPVSEDFFPDFAKVSGFLTAPQLEANKVAYVDEFMGRTEFQTKYSSTFSNPTAYVEALLTTVGLPNHPSKGGWIATLNSANTSQNRALVLRQLVESAEVYNKYYNEAFVIMQYFGYLRRTADASYLSWINTMNQTNGDYRIMINGFMNSAEYRRRFGP